MIGDRLGRVDIDIARDRWVRRNDRVECKGDYCLFWRLEWVRAYHLLPTEILTVLSQCAPWLDRTDKT